MSKFTIMMSTQFNWPNRTLLAALMILNAGAEAILAEVPAALLSKLQRAEQSRGDLGTSGLQWTVVASMTEKGEKKGATIRAVTQRGKAFAEFLAPEEAKGKKYLVADGKMWFHKPKLSRAVSVSKRQRLMGNASIGDFASTSFLVNYEPESVSDVTLNGEACHLFTLKKRSRRASYGRIRYWISIRRSVGLKAEFETTSGKVIRSATMEYENSVSVGGKKIPLLSRMTVNETIGSAKVTRLTFREVKKGTFPDTLFDPSALAPKRDKRIRRFGK